MLYAFYVVVLAVVVGGGDVGVVVVVIINLLIIYFFPYSLRTYHICTTVHFLFFLLPNDELRTSGW